MSSFYEDDYDPTEPFSQDEFITHDNAQLKRLDAGEDVDGDYDEEYGEE